MILAEQANQLGLTGNTIADTIIILALIAAFAFMMWLSR
jgi:hypothetical protein